MTQENDPSTQDSSCSAAGEDDMMELFDLFARWMSPMSDLLELDTISHQASSAKHSLQGKSPTYQVIVQNIITSALLDTGANILVILERFFRSVPQTPQLLKVCIIRSHQLVGLI